MRLFLFVISQVHSAAFIPKQLRLDRSLIFGCWNLEVNITTRTKCCDEWKIASDGNFQTRSSDDDEISVEQMTDEKVTTYNRFEWESLCMSSWTSDAITMIMAFSINKVAYFPLTWAIFDFSTLRSLFDEDKRGRKMLTRYPNVFSVGNRLFLFFIVANMPWMCAAFSGYSNSIVTSLDDEWFTPYGYCKFYCAPFICSFLSFLSSFFLLFLLLYLSRPCHRVFIAICISYFLCANK